MGSFNAFDGTRSRRLFIVPRPQTKEWKRKTMRPEGFNQNMEPRILAFYQEARMSIETIAANEGLSRLYVQDVIRRALAMRRAA